MKRLKSQRYLATEPPRLSRMDKWRASIRRFYESSKGSELKDALKENAKRQWQDKRRENPYAKHL